VRFWDQLCVATLIIVGDKDEVAMANVTWPPIVEVGVYPRAAHDYDAFIAAHMNRGRQQANELAPDGRRAA
jgi:hypothetical protein